MKFIDEVTITISSGHGGPGAVSFRREAMTPRGGPDGGDGGRGGDVVIVTDKGINSLIDYNPGKKYAAQDGTPGAGRMCSGAAGQDLILKVPEGTIVRGEDGNILVDMLPESRHVILQGGRGGKGNTFFKTSVNQAPDRAQPGEPNQFLKITMELKLLADVGIIGLPNAGKSTLISRISAARPKIGDYPFTTLIPNLGVVKWKDDNNFVVADIPGLIEGAHKGVGLGIQFLKHVERTRIFIHLIDISLGDLDSAILALEQINYELKMYDEANQDKDGFFSLCERPQIVVLNKIDALPVSKVEELLNGFKTKTKKDVLAISGVSGKGIPQLLNKVGEQLFGLDKEGEHL